MKHKWLVSFGLAALLTVAGDYTVSAYKPSVVPVEKQQGNELWEKFHQLQIDLQKATAKFHGTAGILIQDLATGDDIKINADTPYPSASLVKMPIMAAYYQAQAEGKLSLDDKIVLRRQEKINNCSHLFFARCGRSFPIRALIERMITESDNTAANMLVDHLGFVYLNEKFVQFGLKNTDLRRGIMDLKWRNAGIENYTTAQDMAFLLNKIYKGELVSPEASAEMLDVLKRQKVNDRIPRFLPDTVTVAHKTGLLKNTVSDVGIVFTPHGDFIICVITADIRGYHSAKRFISKVAAATYDRCYRRSSAVART
ncbi:MAG: serine hydrolase [Endomicrobiales bacterium]|jgi:beta-lactamase class A